ncbi:MAG: phage holin family protein [Candidatus Promineofilum sp.]|nr:phage holin family protein [Promineifilum sp.]
MRFIIRLLISAVALGVTFWLVDLCWDGQVLPLIIIALLFGLVNALIRPLLIILTCPLIVLTLGLGIFVINVLMLWLTIWLANRLGFGFTCVPDFFWNLIIGAVVLSLVSWGVSLLIPDDMEKGRQSRAAR